MSSGIAAALALVCACSLQAGVITTAQFNLNTARQTQFAPDSVSMTYGPSAIAGFWTADASSPSALKASVTVGSDSTVQPNSYSSTTIGSTTTYGNPAARVTAGYWDIMHVMGGPGTGSVDFDFALSGSRTVSNAAIHANVRLTAASCLEDGPGCTTYGQSTYTLKPEDSAPASFSLSVSIPFDTDFYLIHQIELVVVVPDRQTNFNNSPESQVTNVHASPYSFSATADFSNTLTLNNVVFRDMFNNTPSNVNLTLQEGGLYPFENATVVTGEVPEPGTFAIAAAGLAVILLRRSRLLYRAARVRKRLVVSRSDFDGAPVAILR